MVLCESFEEKIVSEHYCVPRALGCLHNTVTKPVLLPYLARVGSSIFTQKKPVSHTGSSVGKYPQGPFDRKFLNSNIQKNFLLERMCVQE